MDPNSQHQLWSRWTARVLPAATPTTPPYEVVRENCARFYRKAFGSATELQITAAPEQWVIDCRTEGHPAHDPVYQAYMVDQLRHFLANGFPGAEITFSIRIEAGDRQDGRPPDQSISGPPPVVLVTRLVGSRG